MPRFHHGLNPPGHIIVMEETRWHHHGSLGMWELLVWDATCSDTFAPSYITSASTEAGAVAIIAEERKRKKYCDLATTHIFQPVAVETAGTFGPATFKFLKSLENQFRAR